jgi:hypothetical protein
MDIQALKNVVINVKETDFETVSVEGGYYGGLRFNGKDADGFNTETKLTFQNTENRELFFSMVISAIIAQAVSKAGNPGDSYHSGHIYAKSGSRYTPEDIVQAIVKAEKWDQIKGDPDVDA